MTHRFQRLCLVALAVTGCASPMARLERERAALVARLDAIIIPRVEFKDTPLRECAHFLTQASRRRDATGKAIGEPQAEVILSLSRPGATTLSFIAHNVTLKDAVRVIAEVADLHWVALDDHRLVIYDGHE